MRLHAFLWSRAGVQQRTVCVRRGGGQSTYIVLNNYRSYTIKCIINLKAQQHRCSMVLSNRKRVSCILQLPSAGRYRDMTPETEIRRFSLMFSCRLLINGTLLFLRMSTKMGPPAAQETPTPGILSAVSVLLIYSGPHDVPHEESTDHPNRLEITKSPLDNTAAAVVYLVVQCIYIYICLLYTSPSPRD